MNKKEYMKIYQRKYRKTSKGVAYRLSYYQKHKEQIKKLQSSYYNKRNGRNRFLIRNYGITIDEYENLLKLQGGRCFICHRTYINKNLCVDHDHITGIIRGLICARCNGYLGWYEQYKTNILSFLNPEK